MAGSLLGTAGAFQAPPTIVETVGPIAAFPLRLSGASVYTKRRLALVGDAAHTVHPLAGQGLNLGIADATALADALLAAAHAGQDLGSELALRPYEAQRTAANLAMMGIVDGIKRLYASGGPDPSLFSLARTLGMGAFNLVEPIKREAVLFAMGGRGSLLAAALQAAAPSVHSSARGRARRGSFDEWL